MFGISLSSTVEGNSESALKVRVGNTLMKEPEDEFTKPEDVKEYNRPIPLHKVTKMPKPIGDCKGEYPKRAKSLGIEGVVKLRVQVLAEGKVGSVSVLQKLGYGLDEVAVAALKKCAFEPAQMGEYSVTTLILYTYEFRLDE